jgi:hypothetical protein
MKSASSEGWTLAFMRSVALSQKRYSDGSARIFKTRIEYWLGALRGSDCKTLTADNGCRKASILSHGAAWSLFSPP